MGFIKDDYSLSFYLAQEGKFAGTIFAVLRNETRNNDCYFVRDTFKKNIEWQPVEKKNLEDLIESDAQSISDIFKDLYDAKYLINTKYGTKTDLIIAESKKGFKLTSQGNLDFVNTETKAIVDVIPKDFTEGKNASYQDAHMTYLYTKMEDDLSLEFRTYFLEKTSGYEAEEAAELNFKNKNTSLPDWLMK